MKQKDMALNFKRVGDGSNRDIFSKNKNFLLIVEKFIYHGL